MTDGNQRPPASTAMPATRGAANAVSADNIPLLTEVVELPSDVFDAPAVAGIDDDPDGSPTAALAPAEDDLRAVRSELMSRVMMRFRTEWPQVVQAHTEATLQARLAPLTRQLADELTQALEARLVEWLDATLEEIERTPGRD